MKRYTVVTLFPELVHAFRAAGVVGRAHERGLVSIDALNPRACTHDRRATVDDTPYGGGPGMVMMAGPLTAAIREARARAPALVVYLSPQGRRFHQREIPRLAAVPHLVLVAGRYEGIDERVVRREIDEEWSVGDFVVSGGELPALLMVDAIVRTLPDALGDAGSAGADSFSDGLLDYPHYTRPEVFEGEAVPPVLLSGHHAEIAAWRRAQQLGRTWLRRPDLLPAGGLGASERRALERFLDEEDGVPTRDR